ncbi:AAA domain containing protein [uncultured Caudovirales phage]|uniref:AAA domain containing protein n=1 Tax=uncultured Caudovirales phage TaxID=2100421 RepID=A0A6J5MZH1_9CAUD|nr:AAA domain containing protein [uncultured Caudovirales phage]
MAGNPFKKAQNVEPKMKVLVYGASGVGKTFFALSGKGKIAVIDTEGGTAHYAGREGLQEFDVLPTKTYKDVKAAVEFVAANPEAYGTLVIDPLTVIWETLQDSAQIKRAAANLAKGRGTGIVEETDLEMLDWGRIKRQYKSLLTAIINLPIHTIVIAREKDETEKRGDQMVRIGSKPDCEKGTPYFFDTVLRMFVDGGARKMTVVKDRTGSNDIKSEIVDPTFESVFAKALGVKGGVKRAQMDEGVAAALDAEEELADEALAGDIRIALVAAGVDSDALLKSRGWDSFTDIPKQKAEEVLKWALAKGAEGGI